MRRRFPITIVMGLILLWAIFLRVRIIQNEFTIDEIWSLHMATWMHSWLDVFALHVDNNHYLNTLWMYILGQNQAVWMYRMPSFVSGIALVALVMQQAAQKKSILAVITGIVVAGSPILILYSGVARGYMPMIFFGALSYLQMERTLKTLKPRDALLFALYSMIAFLWQLMYIHLFAALVIWAILQLWPMRNTRVWIALHLSISPVILMLYLLAIADFSHMMLLGGPPISHGQMLLSSVALIAGLPHTGFWTVFVGLCILTAITADVEREVQHHRPKGYFFVTLFLLSPILWLLFFHPDWAYPRYFIVPLFFALLMSCTWIEKGISHTHPLIRTVCVLLLCGYLVGNTISQKPDLVAKHGYSVALDFLQTHIADSTITIGSNSDVRTKRLLWFFTARLGGAKPVISLNHNDRAHRTPAVWLIDKDVGSVPEMINDSGHTYVPWPDAPSSLSHWAIFRLSK